MSMFEGYRCQFCDELLTKDDDVVVCPDCGAPYHRSCYLESGECVFSDEHAAGYVWKGDKEGISEDDETVRCARCGTDNPISATTCSDCGSLLRATAYEDEKKDEPSEASPLGGYEQIENEEISGIKVKDMKRYLGGGWFFLLPTFYNIGKYGRKLSLNVIAMFTHGLWFIAKKMYGLGIFLLLLMSGAFVFQLCVSDLIEPLTDYVYANNSTGVMAFMYANPTLTGIWMLCGFMELAIYVFCGFYANRVYYSRCVKKIHKLQHLELGADAYGKKLDAVGGTSIAGVLVAGICFFGGEMLATQNTAWFITARESVFNFFQSGAVQSTIQQFFELF